MNAITIQATISNADFPIIQHLFEKLKIKNTILDTSPIDNKKKTIPTEKSIPNEETHKAFVEMRENRHSIKGNTDVNLMVKDILEEDDDSSMSEKEYFTMIDRARAEKKHEISREDMRKMLMGGLKNEFAANA